MKLKRHYFTCALIALPTLVMCALGVYFIIDKVPEIEKLEQDRIKAIYRETALEIKEKPIEARGIDHGETFKGIKTAGKMAPGKWGFSPIPLKRITHVWYTEGARTWATTVEYERPHKIGVAITYGGIAIMMILAMITFICIRCFCQYMKERDDFMVATAHDLTTPLTALRLRLVRSNDEDTKRVVERMFRLVENIKDFLLLGAHRPEPKRERVDLVTLYSEAYSVLAPEFRDLLGSDIPYKGPTSLAVIVDPTLTVQIIWNLLGNDLKYAAPFGAVKVSISEVDGMAELKLIDEGKGMTHKEMKRAFNRYYRAKTVLKSGKGGFGIGLATAREFAIRMGGTLAVEANTPHGCIFILRLPM